MVAFSLVARPNLLETQFPNSRRTFFPLCEKEVRDWVLVDRSRDAAIRDQFDPKIRVSGVFLVFRLSGSGALPRWLCVTLSYPQLPILLSNNGLVPAAASRGPHRRPCCEPAMMLAIASGLLYGAMASVASVQRRGSSPISTDRRQAPSPRQATGRTSKFPCPCPASHHAAHAVPAFSHMSHAAIHSRRHPLQIPPPQFRGSCQCVGSLVSYKSLSLSVQCTIPAPSSLKL